MLLFRLYLDKNRDRERKNDQEVPDKKRNKNAMTEYQWKKKAEAVLNWNSILEGNFYNKKGNKYNGTDNDCIGM